MPASRSARAMIFAPRSWPSSPGLATTTRILPFVSLGIVERTLVGESQRGVAGAGRLGAQGKSALRAPVRACAREHLREAPDTAERGGEREHSDHLQPARQAV